LGKHPDRFQTKELNFGKAHVFFPEANKNSCTAALLLDLNSISLAKAHQRKDLDDYKLAPFHILATEGKNYFDKNHVWQMENLHEICQVDASFFIGNRL